MTIQKNHRTLLCVANYDSNVGYAWWLMESFWVALATQYKSSFTTALAYPSISTIPKAVTDSALDIHHIDFKSTDLTSIYKQLRFIKRQRVKVVYFSDQPTTSWRYALFRLFGVKKILVHDHTPGLRPRSQGIKRLIKTIRSHIPLINCDAAIGATEFVKKRLHDVTCIPKNKCHSAPNGIPPQKNATTDAESAIIPQLQDDAFAIISTGRANRYKGVEFGLRVIHDIIVNRGMKNIRYLYCGEGPHLEEFKSLAKELGVSQHTSFLGRVNNIPELLKQCSIAFHPSKGEVGYSLSILEYMQAGLPVVVPDNPSVCGATIHNTTGLIYQENNIASAVDNILSLANDLEKTQALGHQARKLQQEQYQLRHTHDALLKTFAQVI